MAKKGSKPADKLKEISQALKREMQVKNWKKELLDKKAIIEKQLEHARNDLEAVKEILDKDAELTAAARQMMNIALELQAGSKDSLNIYNPNYVTTEDKEKLLTKILEDYKSENPKAKSMSFTNIKNVLLSRYKIESQSAGMFFRNQLKEYQTTGGNKNKAVVL
ncbi:hypothetical protein N9B10_06265 [Pirellulales bacterium]|jgi:hypothetical protein|nr:hypothetical protein [Pirellulales bacterium]